MPLTEFAMSILNAFLIIIAYCSIFTFITMLCSEITVSITACTLIFISIVVAQMTTGYTANLTPYITNTYYEDGQEYIVSQEPSPNYPGEKIVKRAKMVYLSLPQGQAHKIASGDTRYLYEMPMYSIILIGATNIIGVYLFNRKELK